MGKWRGLKINELTLFYQCFSGHIFVLFILASKQVRRLGYKQAYDRWQEKASVFRNIISTTLQKDILCLYVRPLNCKVIIELNVNLYLFHDVDCGFVVSLILLDKSHLTFKSCLSDITHFRFTLSCALYKKIEDKH